jgi:hypothetical protein
MNINRILKDLYAERGRIDQAIDALEGVISSSGTKRRGRPPGRSVRKVMSADAKRRIGAAMRKRWAQRKRKLKAA